MQGNQEGLRQEIIEDAGRKARRALTRAEREAKKIIEQGRKERDRMLELSRRQAESRVQREQASLEATFAAEMRRIELGAAEELIQGVFDRAVKALVDRDDTKRRADIERLASEAIGHMDGSRFLVDVAERDRDLIDDDVLKSVARRAGRAATFTVEANGHIEGGVRIMSSDRRQVYDNTYRARLARMAPELRLVVAEMIFPEEPRP